VKYDLAGGMFPTGTVDFDDDEIRSVSYKYEALRIDLKNGQTYYVSRARYEEKFSREGWLR